MPNAKHIGTMKIRRLRRKTAWRNLRSLSHILEGVGPISAATGRMHLSFLICSNCTLRSWTSLFKRAPRGTFEVLIIKHDQGWLSVEGLKGKCMHVKHWKSRRWNRSSRIYSHKNDSNFLDAPFVFIVNTEILIVWVNSPWDGSIEPYESKKIQQKS